MLKLSVFIKRALMAALPFSLEVYSRRLKNTVNANHCDLIAELPD